MEVRYGVLGPLEVSVDGRPVQISGLKQRVLLAVLLLNANRVVSTDRLIDALWGEAPPDTAGKALQVRVSQLRKLLGRDRVETKAPGYSLRVEADELDLERFQRLAGEGRFHEALSLWRGPPLDDLRGEPFARTEIARLEEFRYACVEDRVEADLAGGRHAPLVAELEQLVAQEPHRQRLRGQLMLALYRSGRDAEALQVYQDGRHELVERLGIEPAKALRELQRAILAQDPSLDGAEAAPAVGKAAPAPDAVTGPFVGREGELAELVAGLEDAAAGRGRLFLLSGEPGIGKSRLADEIVARARERGARVLFGRCWEAGGAPAYWPWVQSVRTYLRERERDALRAELGAGAADLAQLFPDLRDLYPDLPEPPAGESEGARFRLFDAMTGFLHAASEAQPIVLVLDDLHAADEPSLLLLQFLAREIGSCRLLVVGAYRDVDPTPVASLTAVLAELAREPATRRIALTGIARPAVARFLELATTGRAAPELAAALHTETDGNPLFVGEIVRLLATEDRLAGAVAGTFAIPATVRDVISRRLRHLSGSCNELLTVAAALGREFDLAALARAAQVGDDELVELLDEAVAARVVTDVDAPGQLGRMRFAHVLIRDTLYAGLTTARRVALHRRVADALEDLYRDSIELHLDELAHHFHASARREAAEKALEYTRRAAERSVKMLAYEDAARLYEQALEILAGLNGDRAIRCELLLALGDAYARAGRTVQAKATFRDAAQLAESLELADALARAALGYGGRIVWEVSRGDHYLVSLLRKALAAVPEADSPLRARLLARLAGGPLRASETFVSERHELSRQGLDMGRRLGDPSTLAYTLQGYIASHHSPDFVPEQAALAEEFIAAALDAGDIERAVEGYEVHFQTSIELADAVTARADLQAMSVLADELRQPAQRWLVLVLSALLALLEGRFDEAESLVAEAHATGVDAQRWSAEVSHGLQLFVLRQAQGRLDEIEALIRRLADENVSYPICRCVLVAALAELGRTEEAERELDAVAADRFSLLPFNEEWEVSVCLLAGASAALRPGGDTTRELYELLLPYRDRIAISYPEISLGPVAGYLGTLAAALGLLDEAAEHFRHAVELCTRIGAEPSRARALERHARVLVEHGLG